ncbi:MAG: hypothetical protein JXQ73_15440 [Phycisphaerae bacterium]|nr:hypothetical protein [Phycisphaerae bacterium]
MSTQRALLLLVCLTAAGSTDVKGQEAWNRARQSAKIAGYSLGKVQRWLHEKCLPAIDKETGLYRWQSSKQWNYADTAADCYPFVCWAAYFTDKAVLDGPMRKLLHAEQRLCNHVDRLPVPYDLVKKQKVSQSLDQVIFGASEYAKDGLVAIVELTGKDEWYDRMKAIVEDIFTIAKIDTPYGKIPSTNIEVNGELLQLLPRLYAMTGDRKYLDWAHRLADHYLKPGKFVPQRLSDHGCEIIGGLGLLLAVDSSACPEKFKEYEPHYRYLCDEIIRRGTNSDGIIVGRLQPTPGPHDAVQLRDGWGYDYVGFLDYDMATGQNRYRKQIEFAMSNLLKPRYKNFNWDHNSRDNIADSVEGGLYLLNRLPVKQGFEWADREIDTVLVDTSKPLDQTWLWDTHKLEANTVRTVLIHATMHTRNTILRPWRTDLRLGAAPIDGGLAIVVTAERPYSGKLQFDIPRHRLYMGFKKDWPRMNTVPEWFTVELDKEVALENLSTNKKAPYTGKQLHEGVPVELPSPGELRLRLVSRLPEPAIPARPPPFR